jgi:endonuclease/exonuclease/phosphatase family metal-dependent hydrolase
VLDRTDFLLVAVHLQSKLHWSDRDQALACTRLVNQITREEDRFRHQRTILVGDLNMNPFEDGVVGAHGLHAVMTMNLAEAATRDVDAAPYRFFYNPMWAQFGDRTDGPPGTYYLRESRPVTYFWNTFDQVMLRPQLMRRLSELRVLTTAGGASLLSPSGHPDASVGSDHLPVFFSVEF